MKIELAFKSFINENISKLIKQMGYSQKGSYYYFIQDNLQFNYEVRIESKSKKSIEFIILASANSTSIDKLIGKKSKGKPKGFDNLYYRSIANINELSASNSFNYEVNSNNKDLAKSIENYLIQAEEKLCTIVDDEALIDCCITENGLIHHESIFKYLIVTNDETRLKIYLANIKTKLYSIADKAYASYVDKLNNLKIKYIKGKK
jgi:hypothetical protein